MLAKLFRLTSIALLACLASACIVLQPTGLPQNESSATTAAPTSACAMNLVDSTFGGYCGNLEVVNNGLYPMQSWQVVFDLPAGASLISSWNGNFNNTDNHVVVSPLEPNVPIVSEGKIDLGYCASGAAENVAVIPGSCVAQDANGSVTTVSSTSLNTPFSTDFAANDDANWRVAITDDGPATACVADSNAVHYASPGLELQDCGGLQYTRPILYGAISARMQAAAGAGLITQVMSGIRLPPGLQGVALSVASDTPSALTMTVWQDGVAKVQSVALGFDATAAAHVYEIVWQANSVVWSVDSKTVGTQSTALPQAAPEYLTVSVQSKSLQTTQLPAVWTQLAFAPVVSIQ